MESKIAGIILIAPITNHDLNLKIKNIPILLVWGKDDPIVPFEKSKEIEEDCNYLTPLYFDEVVKLGVNRSLAHQPDLMRYLFFYYYQNILFYLIIYFINIYLPFILLFYLLFYFILFIVNV